MRGFKLSRNMWKESVYSVHKDRNNKLKKSIVENSSEKFAFKLLQYKVKWSSLVESDFRLWFSVLITVGSITREYQAVRATSCLHLQCWNELILNKRCNVYKFFHDAVGNWLLRKEARIQKIECVLRMNIASQINVCFYFTDILSLAFPISESSIEADYLFQVHLIILQALYL